MTTFNASQPQNVRILYVLKGARPSQGEVKVRLSTLNVLGGGNFDVGERYWLCLRSDASSIYLVSVFGSAFRVPAGTNLRELRANDVRANIAILLTDLVRQTNGPNAAAVEKEAADYFTDR